MRTAQSQSQVNPIESLALQARFHSIRLAWLRVAAAHRAHSKFEDLYSRLADAGNVSNDEEPARHSERYSLALATLGFTFMPAAALIKALREVL